MTGISILVRNGYLLQRTIYINIGYVEIKVLKVKKEEDSQWVITEYASRELVAALSEAYKSMQRVATIPVYLRIIPPLMIFTNP